MSGNPEAIVEAYEQGRIGRILLIRISRVGDLLFTTPAVRCLKARFPQSELHFLTNPYSAQVLAGNPHVSRIHLMDRKSVGWRFFRTARVIPDLKSPRFDLVIPFRWRNEYKSLFAKIKAPHVYRLSVADLPAEGQSHMADRFLSGLAPLGVKQDAKGMDVFFNSDDETWVDEFLTGHRLQDKPLVVLHPGCHQTMKLKRGRSAAKRTWPVAHWADLVKELLNAMGASPVLTGFSGGDMAQNDAIIKRAGIDVPQFAGQSVNRLAALLARAGGFVCGDTGPLHVGSAVGVPTVALFGPSNPAVTGPYRNTGGAVVLQKEIECVPCKGKDIKCENNVCMQSITAEEVGKALSGLMNSSGRPDSIAGTDSTILQSEAETPGR